MNAATVGTALGVVDQSLTVLSAVASPFMTPNQAKVLQVATALFGIASQSIQTKVDVPEMTMAQLNADELLIVVDDQRAQAEAVQRARADTDLRAGGG